MATLPKTSLYCFGTGCFGYVATFFHETTFHGFRHIVMPRRHWFEVLLWSAIVASSSIGATWIMFRNYDRYKESPIVTSVYKNFRSWNITLPGTTLCFGDKFDEKKGKTLVKNRWGVEEGDEKFEYYMNFLRTVSNNSSYNSLNGFAAFENDEVLNKENLTILMDEVKELQVAYDPGPLKPTLHVKESPLYHRTMLEMGICYSFNSLITRDLDLDPGILETDSDETFIPIYCFYFHSVCYGVTEHLNRKITFYIHSPYEIPEVTSKPFFLERFNHLTTMFKHLDILSSSRIRPLRPKQRHCYFYDESQYDNMKYYSFNLCKIQCRRDLAMKLCKCVPHFYKKQAGQPQCTIKQLICINKHSQELTYLTEIKNNKTIKRCDNCYQACEEVNYYLESELLEPWQPNRIHITKYHWGIDRYSKTRLKREILFGVEDLLTSLGGTAGFFLGSSIMSGIELIYFFTLRLIRYVIKKSIAKQKTKLQVVESFPPPPPRHHWKTARQHSFQIARQRRVQTLAPYY